MYKEQDLVGIAKRENNKKRNYLVVNQLQGKHIPVVPSQAFTMFHDLSEKIKLKYQGQSLLLVGFAETATAIGAAAATELSCRYIQTTREQMKDVNYLFFTESHSHATEQKLVREDIEQALFRVDRIVFVEDEVTTGNTIHKIIQIIKEQYAQYRVSFAVASILNGMDTVNMERFSREDIDLLYLVKTEHSNYSSIAEQFQTDGDYYMPDFFCETKPVSMHEYKGLIDARRMVDGDEYQKACEKLLLDIMADQGDILKQHVLVLGTEEFMYPALFVASALQQLGNKVVFHATTRSPIAVSKNAGYPLSSRFELRSLYEKDRITFLYNLDHYDIVFVITDALMEPEGVTTLVHALEKKENKNIHIIRWKY